MSNQALIEQLIEAHLIFLQQEFADESVIKEEFSFFYQWLCKQQLKDLFSFEQIHQLLSKQILATAFSENLLQQLAEQIRFALVHPIAEKTAIADVIPVLTVDRVAQYVASKEAHRQKLVHNIVSNPAFSAMISQLIQHAIQDYLENSSMVKHVPGVSRFMQMGKSVLESVTDANLDMAIQNYLQKNILKLSQICEQVLNHNLSEDKLYHLQANLWHQVKNQPLSKLKNYIEINELEQSIEMTVEVWDYLRQSEYLKQQLHDGIYTWYSRNQEHNFDLLLRNLNIDQQLVEGALSQMVIEFAKQLNEKGYLEQRARQQLEKFYYSEAAQNLLNKNANQN